MVKRLRNHSVGSESGVSDGMHQVSSRRRSPSRTPPAKIATSHITTDARVQVMHCSLPPHRESMTFPSYEDYETHYQQTHVNRCSECGKNFPATHYLNLHIEENHDPLILALRDRGEKTFGCFVEGCERKCSTPQKRRRHLIDKHMFPRNYNFFIVNDGIDKQYSLLQPLHGQDCLLSTSQSVQEGRLRNRKTSISLNTVSKAVDESRDDSSAEVDSLASSLSALRFVPASVSRKSNSHKQIGQV